MNLKKLAFFLIGLVVIAMVAIPLMMIDTGPRSIDVAQVAESDEVVVMIIPNTGSAAANPEATPGREPILLTATPTAFPAAYCGAIYAFDFEAEVVRLMNVERAARNIAPLVLNDKLSAAARKHTVDMVCRQFISHTGLNGSTFSSRIDAEGYSWLTAGENIAAGYASPAAAIKGWMASPPHRANILNPAFVEVGIGYASKSGTTYTDYWTASFAQPSP